MKKAIKILYTVVVVLLVFQCANDDNNSRYIPPANPDISNVNDTYLYNNNGNSLFERYGTATRWRWNDNFIDPNERATPIREDLVIPITKLVEYLWIDPYMSVGESGAKIIKDFFPAEVVYVGSYIYQDDGSIKLGYAEGGARVTLLNVNSLDFQDRDWLADPRGGILATIHHEFSHIIQQTFGNPVGLNIISEKYEGVNWINISTNDAIKLGMVSDYGASTEFEDFCEIISHFLVLDETTFNEAFINQEDCSVYTNTDEILNCQELNEGRQLIQEKLGLIIEYFDNQLNVDLIEVRNALQERLNNLIETGEIPE